MCAKIGRVYLSSDGNRIVEEFLTPESNRETLANTTLSLLMSHTSSVQLIECIVFFLVLDQCRSRI